MIQSYLTQVFDIRRHLYSITKGFEFEILKNFRRHRFCSVFSKEILVSELKVVETITTPYFWELVLNENFVGPIHGLKTTKRVKQFLSKQSLELIFNTI